MWSGMDRDVDLIAAAEHEASFLRKGLFSCSLLILDNLKVEAMIERVPVEAPTINHSGKTLILRLYFTNDIIKISGTLLEAQTPAMSLPSTWQTSQPRSVLRPQVARARSKIQKHFLFKTVLPAHADSRG